MKIDELGLIPVRNFGIVDEEKQIYRSAQPQFSYEYGWLSKMLGLKHIINLRSESTHDNMFASDYGITYHQFEIKDHHCPDIQQVEDFKKLLLQSVELKEPILFHCEHGHGRTSTFSVLTSFFLGKSLGEALANEENRFHYQFKHHCQTDFLMDYYSKL